MAVFKFVAHDGYDKEGHPTNFMSFTIESKNSIGAINDAKHHFKSLGRKFLSAGYGKNSLQVAEVKKEEAST